LWFLPDDDGMERPKHVVVKQINERGKFECCVRLDLNRYLVVHRLSKNSIFSIRYIIIQFLYSKNIIVFKFFFVNLTTIVRIYCLKVQKLALKC